MCCSDPASSAVHPVNWSVDRLRYACMLVMKRLTIYSSENFCVSIVPYYDEKWGEEDG